MLHDFSDRCNESLHCFPSVVTKIFSFTKLTQVNYNTWKCRKKFSSFLYLSNSIHSTHVQRVTVQESDRLVQQVTWESLGQGLAFMYLGFDRFCSPCCARNHNALVCVDPTCPLTPCDLMKLTGPFWISLLKLKYLLVREMPTDHTLALWRDSTKDP